MATTIPDNVARVEQLVRYGDSYSLTLRRADFSFTAYTCTAILYSAKKAVILTLAVAKSGTGDDTLTITATDAQMQLPLGVYYLRLKIASGAVVNTLLENKITIINLPTW